MKKPNHLELPRAYLSWVAALSIAGLTTDEVAFVMQTSPEVVRQALAAHGVTDDTYALPAALKEELIEESTARDFAQARGEIY